MFNMEKKTLFGYDYTNNEFVKIILYLFIGGTAALLEWTLFYVLYGILDGLTSFRTVAATSVAFSVATVYHYWLGNVFVFVSGSRYSRSKEISLVFAVSAVGLLFNVVLMYLFVDFWMWHPMFAKVCASAVVVVWNYLSRKKWIFRSGND